jgi:hypothetical protein
VLERLAVRGEQPYRLSISLPRETSQKLNVMQAEMSKTLERKVTKNELVIRILEQFFWKAGKK